MGRTVLVVGGGGREHALAIGLVESPSVHSVHVAPGNAGTAEIATNHAVSAGDVDGQVALAQRLCADLVVVGPEAPLVAGLSDALRAVFPWGLLSGLSWVPAGIAAVASVLP